MKDLSRKGFENVHFNIKAVAALMQHIFGKPTFTPNTDDPEKKTLDLLSIGYLIYHESVHSVLKATKQEQAKFEHIYSMPAELTKIDHYLQSTTMNEFMDNLNNAEWQAAFKARPTEEQIYFWKEVIKHPHTTYPHLSKYAITSRFFIEWAKQQGRDFFDKDKFQLQFGLLYEQREKQEQENYFTDIPGLPNDPDWKKLHEEEWTRSGALEEERDRLKVELNAFKGINRSLDTQVRELRAENEALKQEVDRLTYTKEWYEKKRAEMQAMIDCRDKTIHRMSNPSK